MSDIKFSPHDIKEECAELKSSAAPGQDGIPAALLKECREQLSTPLFYFWRGSLDSVIIPTVLLLILITPVFKGGNRSATKITDQLLSLLTSLKVLKK